MKKLSPKDKGLILATVTLVAVLGVGGLVLISTTQPSVQIPPHAPTPAPNGINLYLAAAGAVAPANPVIDATNDVDALKLTGPEKAERYSLARRQTWERASNQAWTLFEQAKAAESLFPESRLINSAGINHSRLRQLARDKTALANTCALRDDWAGTLRNDLDDIEMGHDIMRGGDPIAVLVGIAMSAMGTRNVEVGGAHFDSKGVFMRDNAVAHLSADQSIATAKRLEELIASTPRLSEIMREEKAVTQTQWLQTWNYPAPGQGRLQALLRPQRQMFQEYSKAADAFALTADQPYGTHTTWPNLTFPVLAASEFKPQRFAFNYTRCRASEQLLLLRLALHAYRLQHARNPAQLSELVPTYLNAVPIDPFGKGEPWRYKAGVAWSVGPDGKDDGGKQIPGRSPKRPFVMSDLWTESLGDLRATP